MPNEWGVGMNRHRWIEAVGDNPWAFFSVVLIITWACGFPGFLLARAGVAPFFPFQALAVVAGVVLPAVIITRVTRGIEGWRDFWRRVLDFRRIPGRWYLVILLFSPTASLLALITELLVGGSLPAFEHARQLLAHPGQLVAFTAFTLVFGPLPEELCWRGFALDRLQDRYRPLPASLLLGLVWALWHVPLFFVPGTFQNGIIGVGTLLFWMFFASIGAETVLMTWIYNNTNRSTLSAILFHFMSNFTGETMGLSDRARFFRGLWTVGAAVVVALWMVDKARKKRVVPDAAV